MFKQESDFDSDKVLNGSLLAFLVPGASEEDLSTLDDETFTIAERKVQVIWMRRRGMTFKKIGEALGVSQMTACRYANDVLESYRTLAAKTAQEHIVNALQKLDDMEEKYERQLARSCGYTWEEWGKSGSSEIEDSEQLRRTGDPKWASLITGIWDRRCELLGLLKVKDGPDPNTMPACKLVKGIDPVEVV